MATKILIARGSLAALNARENEETVQPDSQENLPNSGSEEQAEPTSVTTDK